MPVQLTADQAAFVRRALDTGRFSSEEDIWREALLLWEKRERRRAELLAAVDQADASLATSQHRSIATEEDALQLAGDIKRRGLQRLAASENR
jgi:Arc/MetJ-type ribon-helix-helix transcriptional regulator